jgi:hypothetical protein
MYNLRNFGFETGSRDNEVSKRNDVYYSKFLNSNRFGPWGRGLGKHVRLRNSLLKHTREKGVLGR